MIMPNVRGHIKERVLSHIGPLDFNKNNVNTIHSGGVSYVISQSSTSN